MIIWSLIVSSGVYGQSLIQRLQAVRYDYMSMIVLLIVWLLVRMYHVSLETMVRWLMKILQVMLVISLVWYLAIHGAPGLLEHLGYSMDAWQWVL